MPTTTNSRRPAGPPAYAVIGILIVVLLLGTGAFLWLNGEAGGPTVGGPFTLENSNGQTVTDQTFRGKYMLVYFGYTYCPDVCPTTLNAVADALDRLGKKADELEPIFITVDPKRDTPGVMKQYTAAFTPRLIGLTGSDAEIAAVAKEYHVYYAEHRTGPGPNDYSMDHSSILYLMGPNGRFVAPLRTDSTGPEIASELTKLMS
jgi:protein SCO1